VFQNRDFKENPMTGISKKPYDRDFEIAKLLQGRESSLRYWNLLLGQRGGVVGECPFFLVGYFHRLECVCCCVRVRYFIAPFMHAIDETTEEGVGG
jgi:hypothetical protein